MLLASLIAASLLATSPAPTPAPSCQAPTHTGTFRFTALAKDSSVAAVGMIVLENIDGCLEATMLTDASAPVYIEHAAINDHELTGTVYVSKATAKLTLDFVPAGATGSIVGAGIQWKLAAQRTSGSAQGQ